MTTQGFTKEEWAAAEAMADGLEPPPAETSEGGEGVAVATPPAGEQDGVKGTPAGDGAGSDDDDDPNEGKVTPAERAGFRAEKRKWKARQAQERQAIEQERQRAADEYAGFRKGRELYTAGDYEGAIKEAFGVSAKDYIDGIVMKAKGRDPRVERELAEARKLREQHEEREKQAAQQHAQQQRAIAQQQWAQQNIVAPLKERGEDNLTDPVFVQNVFAELNAEYDEDEKTIGIDLDEAVKRARSKLMPMYERLGKILGNPTASASETPANGSATQSGRATAQKGRKARTVPNSRATSAAAVTNAPDPSVDPKAWDKYFQEKMLAARDDDAA